MLNLRALTLIRDINLKSLLLEQLVGGGEQVLGLRFHPTVPVEGKKNLTETFAAVEFWVASGFVTPCIHFLNSNQVACVAPMAANKIRKEELSPVPEYKLIGSDEEGLGGERASNLTSKRHFSSSERRKHPK